MYHFHFVSQLGTNKKRNHLNQRVKRPDYKVAYVQLVSVVLFGPTLEGLTQYSLIQIQLKFEQKHIFFSLCELLKTSPWCCHCQHYVVPVQIWKLLSKTWLSWEVLALVLKPPGFVSSLFVLKECHSLCSLRKPKGPGTLWWETTHLIVVDSMSPSTACLHFSLSRTHSRQKKAVWFLLLAKKARGHLWLHARLCAGIIVQSSGRVMVIITGGWGSCFLGHQNVTFGRIPAVNHAAGFTPAFGLNPLLLICVWSMPAWKHLNLISFDSIWKAAFVLFEILVCEGRIGLFIPFFSRQSREE